MNTLLVAGGVLTNAAQLLRKIDPSNYDCIIAVDHGYDHCMALGLQPDILMGDLDSVHAVPSTKPCHTDDNLPTSAPPMHPHKGGPTSHALQIIPFAPEKDDTDLRLAAKHALALGATRVDIICATGGRLDQFMGNLSLLEFLQQEAPTLPAHIIDECNIIRLLTPTPNGECQQYPCRSRYLSLIPISKEICFTGEDLKYPAQRLRVQRTNMVSISNEALGNTYGIALHSGKALLIESD